MAKVLWIKLVLWVKLGTFREYFLVFFDLLLFHTNNLSDKNMFKRLMLSIVIIF